MGDNYVMRLGMGKQSGGIVQRLMSMAILLSVILAMAHAPMPSANHLHEPSESVDAGTR